VLRPSSSTLTGQSGGSAGDDNSNGGVDVYAMPCEIGFWVLIICIHDLASVQDRHL